MNDEADLTALPAGFQWGAVRAGIKSSGNLDLGIAVARERAEWRPRRLARPCSPPTAWLPPRSRWAGGISRLPEDASRRCWSTPATPTAPTARRNRGLRRHLRGRCGELRLHLRRGFSLLHRNHRRSLSRRQCCRRNARIEGLNRQLRAARGVLCARHDDHRHPRQTARAVVPVASVDASQPETNPSEVRIWGRPRARE